MPDWVAYLCLYQLEEIIYHQFTASWGEGTTAYLRAKVQQATKRDYQCVTSLY